MLLKCLELQGFKSFPDKTKLTFEPPEEYLSSEEGNSHGVTVIVGPNGSGKSNISDAMRWVLGEISSKSLRGTKMEDVIFGGADSRKPMGFAEVSVTFDNTDPNNRLDYPYDEVIVTRRYYRAGESEYFINRRACRLRDIYEMFMNTGIGRDGYSIIGQGRIAEMVSRKSDERRGIFEDASGIAKYRHKKEETERKLANVDTNMTNVRCVFAEVEKQVIPLARDAEKAKQATDYTERKKRSEISLWLYDTELLRTNIAIAEEELGRASFDYNTAEESLKSLESQNEHLMEASTDNRRSNTTLTRLIKEKTDEVHMLDNQYRVAENNMSHLKELIANNQTTVQEVTQSMERELASAKVYADSMEEWQKKVAQATKKRDACVKASEENEKKTADLEEKIATAFDDIRNMEKEITDIGVRISFLENNKTTDVGKDAAMRDEIAQYEKISADLSEKCAARETKINDYTQAIANLNEKMKSNAAELTDKHGQFQTAQETLNNKKFQRDSSQQRINTFKAMEEHFEGYAASVRYVMKNYTEGKIKDAQGKACGTIYGPLSKVIAVEDRYLVAIETALGANLQNIVVQDEATAKAAMYCLKCGQAGRATFFPLTSMTGISPSREMTEARSFPGFINFADQLVNREGKFDNVISALLGRTVIFDNIDHATAMAKALHYRVKAVTLDGQQINVGGSFTGGSVRQNTGILSRAGEIKRLQEEVNRLSGEIEKEEKALKELGDAIEDLTGKNADAESQRDVFQTLFNAENAQWEQLRAKLDANNTLLAKVRQDFQTLQEESVKCEEEIVRLKADKVELTARLEEVTAARAELDRKRIDSTDLHEDYEKEITALYIAISDAQKDADTQKKLRDDCQARADGFAQQLQALQEKIAGYCEQVRVLEESLKKNREDMTGAEQNLADLTKKRSELEAGGMDFEKKLTEYNVKIREKMAQKDRLFQTKTKQELKLQTLRNDLDKLAGKLLDEYSLTRAEALALNYPPVTAENRTAVAAEYAEARSKLNSLGNVDFDAVEKYEAVRGKYESMKAQIDDMQKSHDDLLAIIAQYETEMKTAFVSSFNKINENFGKTFSELFGGGSAELILADPDNVLESGIDIKAAPPGKIIKNLMQLSGGEQSFIGVALLFAILQTNPAPFCILDEIEAALDEVNVERLAQYIKRYSYGTQFIMITHRRGTMAAATRLYGVTMPEHGISKVLELDVGDIVTKKEGDWNGIFG